MSRQLFMVVPPYGEHELIYCIDELGKPFIHHKYYHIIFAGAGDHIGTPGWLENERIEEISFAQLREAARREKNTAYYDIDESNWRQIVKSQVGPKRKKKNKSTKYS